MNDEISKGTRPFETCKVSTNTYSTKRNFMIHFSSDQNEKKRRKEMTIDIINIYVCECVLYIVMK